MSLFKAYDVRGRVPAELNEEIAYRIGHAYAAFLKPRKVAVGRDIRLSSPALATALIRGLNEAGVEVLDIGVCGTEVVYFATFHYELDGGIMVTASHNPPDYNGMKFVRAEVRPISGDTGLADIEALVAKNTRVAAERAGGTERIDPMPAYIEHLLGYVDSAKLAPYTIAVNAGNGGAGAVIDRLEPHLPFTFAKLHHEPDGTFPNGVPNPMLEAARHGTTAHVLASRAAFGVAWDGDYDRCFLFDERGEFIEGYYIVGLLAQAFLAKNPGATIVHDPRLTWNTLDVVAKAGGRAVESKSGHAFIKQVMRDSDAVYGGEMSAHHYFRSFSYADSGMIPWLAVAEIMSESGSSLSALVSERQAMFPASGEINRKVGDAARVMRDIEARYARGARDVSHVDGVSVEFDDWRFNLRASNTEPLLRLNVEARGDRELMRARTGELLALIGGEPG